MVWRDCVCQPCISYFDLSSLPALCHKCCTLSCHGSVITTASVVAVIRCQGMSCLVLWLCNADSAWLMICWLTSAPGGCYCPQLTRGGPDLRTMTNDMGDRPLDCVRATRNVVLMNLLDERVPVSTTSHLLARGLWDRDAPSPHHLLGEHG